MKTTQKYILLISIHGLIRGKELELGRDADTGGQTKYVLELAQSLSKHPEIKQVDLMTRLLIDPHVSSDYSEVIEVLNPKANIIRIASGSNEYISKEELWDYLDNFADNAISYLQSQAKMPDVIHSHYADAGYVGIRLSHQLGIPLVHTGHSLGRSKRKRLLASGISREAIEKRYNMTRRINAEEDTLSSAERVITSTNQEINEQYAQYDYYEPQQMRVIPPGTDVEQFFPPVGNEWESHAFKAIAKFLKDPKKPIILALSRLDQRKNIQILIEAFGQSKELKEKANLVICAGTRDNPQDLESSAQEVFTDLLFTIDHLMKNQNFTLDNTIFSGDSGNDLDVLISPIKSILVANAHLDVKEKIQSEMNQVGLKDSIYIAQGKSSKLNGNYGAGILEGIFHYFPDVQIEIKNL